MAFYSDCGACLSGDHTRHVEHWGKRPEGVIDGDFCACAGDCAERAAAAFQWPMQPVVQPDPVAARDLEWKQALAPFEATLRAAAERLSDEPELAAIFIETADKLAAAALGVTE